MKADLLLRRSQLIQAIEAAFRDVTWDDGITIQEARAIDDYLSDEEQAAARSLDNEKHWQDIAEAKLREFHDALPFFCEKSYRFYIPAYMIWMLRHLERRDEHSGLDHSTVCSFRIGTASDAWHTRHRNRFDALNLEQKQCVCRFLRHLGESRDFESDVREFLDGYWGRYCD